MKQIFEMVRAGLFCTMAASAAHGLELPFEIDKKAVSHASLPLITKLPDGTQWTVSVSPLNGSRGPLTPGRLYRSYIYSSGLLRRTIEHGGKEQATVFFTKSETLYTDNAGRVQVQFSENEADGPAPRPGHFSELRWISPSNFVGTATFDGKLCDVYQELPSDKKSDNLAAANTDGEARPRLQRTALISQKTRLPAALVEDNSLWIYEFSPERKPFTLPPDFEKALADFRRTTINTRQLYRVNQ